MNFQFTGFVCLLIYLPLISYEAAATNNLDPRKKTEADSACEVCITPEKNKMIEPILAELLPAEQPHRSVDFSFYWELKKNEKTQDLSAESNSAALKLSAVEATQVDSLYKQIFSSTDFDGLINLLEVNRANLTNNQRIALQSLIGQRLHAGYSRTTTQNVDMQSIFANAKVGGRNGGICGDISTFLTKTAAALGYESAGIMSVMYQKELSKDGTGHAINFFRDPATGEYYVQNYNTIFNTHQKDSKSAVEIATRTMGILTGTSYIQSPNRVTHAYMPQTSQWVQEQIKRMAYSEDSESKIVVRLSNNEKFFGVRGKDQRGLSIFAFRNEVQTNAGKYTLDAIGISGSLELREKNVMMLDELGVAVRGYGGLQNLAAPVLRLGATPQQGHQQGLFREMDIDITAKINATTGKLEYKNYSSQHDYPFVEAKTGFDQDLSKQTKLPINAELERTWQQVPKQNNLNGSHTFKTAYDKIGVVYDPTAKNNKYYLKIGADFLLLEGADKMSANAVRTFVKSNIPTERFGEFSVSVDASKVLNNPSKDPFYDSGIAASLTAEWKKKINSVMLGKGKSETGFSLDIKKGNIIQPFGVLGGSVSTPQFQNEKSTTKKLMFFFNQPL